MGRTPPIDVQEVDGTDLVLVFERLPRRRQPHDGPACCRAAPGVTAIDPTPVVGLPAGVEDLGVFWQHACARAGKDLYCWGSNLSGALGNGTTTDSNVAVKVAWP